MKLVKPKKFLGQHFLKDLKVAQDIADTVDPFPELPILEIIIRSFGIAETTSFFRIAVPSFYRLSRQSVANPFPPVTCGREIGVWFCLQNRMACFTFRTALFLVFCLP